MSKRSPLPRAVSTGVFARWLLVAAMLGALGLQWVHAMSGFGGAAAEDFFSRWMYLGIEVAAAVVLALRGLQRRARGRRGSC